MAAGRLGRRKENKSNGVDTEDSDDDNGMDMDMDMDIENENGSMRNCSTNSSPKTDGERRQRTTV